VMLRTLATTSWTNGRLSGLGESALGPGSKAKGAPRENHF